MRLIAIDKVQQEHPGWPFSRWTTGRLIREGKLASVRVGRRHFLTHEIISDFVRRSTVLASAGCGK